MIMSTMTYFRQQSPSWNWLLEYDEPEGYSFAFVGLQGLALLHRVQGWQVTRSASGIEQSVDKSMV